ncbi:MAG: hypothetical protein LUO80_12535 [Methylococcaceae bacterium]|nr:hypothetical protein [Methylococcaceae bacterium]
MANAFTQRQRFEFFNAILVLTKPLKRCLGKRSRLIQSAAQRPWRVHRISKSATLRQRRQRMARAIKINAVYRLLQDETREALNETYF